MRRWAWQMWVVAVCAVAMAGCKTTCPECEKRKAALPCVGDDCAAAKVAPTKPDVAAKPLPTSGDAVAANKPRDLTPSAKPITVPNISPIIAPSLDVPTLMPVPSVPSIAAPPTPATNTVAAPAPVPNLIVPVAQPEETTKETIVIQGVTPLQKSAKFDRASNYQWLMGEVTYLSAKKEWRLRYTSLGANEGDAYGGSVTLTGSAELLDLLKDGQAVRVEGEMLERQPRIAPPYRVSVVKVLD